MTTTSKLARSAAAAIALAAGAASTAAAQPYPDANQARPGDTAGANLLGAPPVGANPTAQGAAADATPSDLPNNFIQPRVALQEAVTDNVTDVKSNKVKDSITRLDVGLDAKFNDTRTKANLSGDVVGEYYATHHAYNDIVYNGTGDLSYTVLDNTLALEAAGARTQGSLTTFGSTDFYRSTNATDYQVSTYYVGPHLTLSPGGAIDMSAAARWGQVLYDTPNNAAFSGVPNSTSIEQVIGAADTKDRYSSVRFLAAGQYEKTDRGFQSQGGSLSEFFAATPRFTVITREGYDNSRQTNIIDLNAPFWSVGGQYTFNERATVRIEGGRRYHRPYYAGSATLHLGRVLYLTADYSDTLTPGPIAVTNVLVDYVGGLDQPLPIPIIPTTYSLTNNFYDQPSINRTGDVKVLLDFGTQNLQLMFTSLQQRYLAAPVQSYTISSSVTYTYNVRPDLDVSFQGLYATEHADIPVSISPLGGNQGYYYLLTGKLEYRLNHLTSLLTMYQNRNFVPTKVTLLQGYRENIGSVALTRRFW